jgi:hypothetical protein
VPARKPKALPADASLVEQIRVTVRALELGPADSATVGLALLLAETIDSLDGEMRAKMLAQTSGQLLAVLRELRSRSVVPAVTGGIRRARICSRWAAAPGRRCPPWVRRRPITGRAPVALWVR